MHKASAIAVALFLAASGCHENAPRTVSLRVAGNTPDASVTIDDQYIGVFAFVQKRGVALPPGKHRITVEKAGYFPWDRLVEAKEGDPPIKLDVALVKVPD
ncbi:PEGA domain-containing protein [Polyangium aurulentum]|uniref:PEGA domain-containing protein n=1 Tax=Polyangium aurulentum TaxID=2567896 RepID=UPI0010AE539F|nr:PEGA domain-containing protein [Polyangium aurulentum]UQA56283.1 PEGA domain-containing protein [Polyangium aurulentum]